MANKKTIRSDNTYIISQDYTENPKLGAKILTNGKESLFLDYYGGYTAEYDSKGKRKIKKHRKREYMKLYLWQAPRTTAERLYNKETLEVAKRIRFEKSQELLQSDKGYRLKSRQEIEYLTYMQEYINNYTKKDIRMVEMALREFKAFLTFSTAYSKYAKRLKPQQITKEMVREFAEYLQQHHRGEGAKSCFQRFKKVMAYAVEHDVMAKDFCRGITIKHDDTQLLKDVLSVEELKQLICTHYENENTEVRRAFIFCLYTGIRFCDVKDLTFSNIDYANKLLKFEQSKTKGHSANSGVIQQLPDHLIKLIGVPSTPDNKQELLFKLPTHTACLKTLRQWVKQAGINKHITWHCARHTFATLILSNGNTDIRTVGALLGHSGLRYVERYTRAIDANKAAAMNIIPNFEEGK